MLVAISRQSLFWLEILSKRMEKRWKIIDSHRKSGSFICCRWISEILESDGYLPLMAGIFATLKTHTYANRSRMVTQIHQHPLCYFICTTSISPHLGIHFNGNYKYNKVETNQQKNEQNTHEQQRNQQNTILEKWIQASYQLVYNWSHSLALCITMVIQIAYFRVWVCECWWW